MITPPGRGETHPSVNYWKSTSAANTFGFKYGDNVYNLLQKRVELLDRVPQLHAGYRQFVSNIDDEALSDKQRHHIENKCRYLRAAYNVALMTLGKDNTTTWSITCCQKAVDQMAEAGYKTTKSRRNVMDWNAEFRKDCKFPHPNPFIANGIRPLPRIFECFPSAELDAKAFIMKHFDHFTISLLEEEFRDTIIPNLMKEAKQDGMDIDSDSYILLSNLTKCPPSYDVVRQWIRYMGFHQERVKKSYYVDGHENDEQQKHRSKFITTYMTDLEPHSHRFIHLTLEEFNTIQSSLAEAGEEEILSNGHSFELDGTEMVEFHVDSHEKLHELANKKYKFGGCVSVRRPPGKKECIIFGQDESVFNQYMFNSKQWVDSNGHRAILPKSTGAGKMISAIQSREVSSYSCCFSTNGSDCIVTSSFFVCLCSLDGEWSLLMNS
jgi:hypothetical protein